MFMISALIQMIIISTICADISLVYMVCLP